MVIELYSKYSSYSEGEIIDYLAEQVIKEDLEFIKWLDCQRFKMKAEQYNLFEYIQCSKEDEERVYEQDASLCD